MRFCDDVCQDVPFRKSFGDDYLLIDLEMCSASFFDAPARDGGCREFGGRIL
jgi:hypothetical protein